MNLNASGMDFSLPNIETESDRIYLGNAIQERLQGYFGPGYTDVSLSKYIVVMLSSKTAKQVIGKSLVEFLGPKDAADCSDWQVKLLILQKAIRKIRFFYLKYQTNTII